MKKVTFLTILVMMFLTIGFSPPKRASAYDGTIIMTI
jgi:hypothetical protein